MTKKHLQSIKATAFVCLLISLIFCFNCRAEVAAVVSDDSYIIQFGSYPQSGVTNGDLIASLDGIEKDWISYDYYSGTATEYSKLFDGSMTSGDYMKFADFEYNGTLYRAVTYTSYRPYYTGYKSSFTYQNTNRYPAKQIHYFRYEPLEWCVLNDDTGLLVSKNIIDSQAYRSKAFKENGECYQDFDSVVFANDYANSDIRQWLNESFFDTAFSESEKAAIRCVEYENKCVGAANGKYDCINTHDFVSLLSYEDADSIYYSSDSERKAYGTDYAKCQGLYVDTKTGASMWKLRSPGKSSEYNCGVRVTGALVNNSDVIGTYSGIRPIIQIDKATIDEGEKIIDNVRLDFSSFPACNNTVVQCAVTIADESAPYELERVSWHEENADISDSLSDSDKFVVGSNYYCEIKLKADVGFEWNEDQIQFDFMSASENADVSAVAYNEISDDVLCLRTNMVTAVHPALLHIEETEAGCETPGHIEYYKCEYCLEDYFDNKGLLKITDHDLLLKPSLGHQFGAWVIIEPAAEDKTGLQERKCLRCGFTETMIIPSKPVTVLTLSSYTLGMNFKSTAQLTASQPVRWYSSDKSVADVDQNGNVYAAGKGKAVITAVTSSGKKAECTVTVKYSLKQMLIIVFLFGFIWYI